MKMPGKLVGMGGAMDLMTGAKKVHRRYGTLRQRWASQNTEEVSASPDRQRAGGSHHHGKVRNGKTIRGAGLTELASGVTLSDVMESIDAELIISISLAQEQRGPSKR